MFRQLRVAAVVPAFNEASKIAATVASIPDYVDDIFVIDDASTDDTWQRLLESGIHCVQGQRNRQKPGAVKTLLAALPASIESIIVIDPDARILSSVGEVERILFEFQRSGIGAACPRITIRPGGRLSAFQHLEYCISFTLGRKALGDTTITSGIAIYRRDALQRVLERHSLSVYAEDLENAVLLLLDGERIYYDGRLVVETEGMPTIRRLFSQRVGWSFGLLKVYAEHWRGLLRRAAKGFVFTYQYIVYMGIFVLVLHPLKLIGLVLLGVSALNIVDNAVGLNLIPDTAITSPAYFVMMYLKYTLLVAFVLPLAAPRGDRRQMLRVVPFYLIYGLAQIVPSTVGFLNWYAVRLCGRRLYRDHYQVAAP